MNKQLQKQKALSEKRAAQQRLRRGLSPWITEISSRYRRGDSQVDRESIFLLRSILKQFYNQTVKNILGFDIREYKQTEEELEKVIRLDISKQLDAFFTARALEASEQISRTASGHVQRASRAAAAETWTERETRRALKNFLTNQTLVISTTEAQTVVETSRGIAVRAIQDPLKNAMQQILTFIETGNYNAAERLSREVVKLAKLPNSVSQGQVIGFIKDNRDRLLTPRFQGQSLARIRTAAEKLQKSEKKWQSIGDRKVRESHNIANRRPPIDINEPFILPGGALQWPGDATLGASLVEIIGCRCTAIYV